MVRVRDVMEHTGADDQVEGARQFADILDREMMEFEVIQIRFALKIKRVTQARFAYGDRGDARARLAEGAPCGLRRAKSTDQKFLVRLMLLCVPQQQQI